MNRYQRVNHFPGCWHMGRKDLLYKLVARMKRRAPGEFSFMPVTYLFPADFDRFHIVRESAPKDHLWIMKPVNQACGRGIKIVTR